MNLTDYINAKVANGETSISLPPVEFQMTSGIEVNPRVRMIDGRCATLFTRSTPGFSPFTIVGSSGLVLRDVIIIERDAETKGRKVGGPSGIHIEKSRGVRLEGVTIKGFGSSVSCFNSSDLTLRDLRCDYGWLFGVFFERTKYINIVDCWSDRHWLDGFKIAVGCEHVSIRGGRGNWNGRSVSRDPKSNGNGIDTYPSLGYTLISGFEAVGNEGAGINIKTGPDNNAPGNGPQRFIELAHNRCIGNKHSSAGLDINSASTGHVSIPEFITINGGMYVDNATWGVRIGRGRNVVIGAQPNGTGNREGLIWQDPVKP
jgi:hypothetical protein